MQVSEAMKRQIEDLKALGYGPTTTAVLRLAVDRMHREHVALRTVATSLGVTLPDAQTRSPAPLELTDCIWEIESGG